MKRVIASAAFILRSRLVLIAFAILFAGMFSSDKTLPIPRFAQVSEMRGRVRASNVSGTSTAKSLFAGAIFTVINAGNGGVGSLRQAIVDANSNPGADMIVFDIPGSGTHVIALTSSLPPITDPVIIDGYTQPGASPNTLSDADNAVILIELNGASAGAGVNGLTINSGLSVARGLKISGFSLSGIVLQAAGGNRVEGSFIIGNSSRGILINAGASGNIIGGATPDARNVISSNGSQGVRILSGSTANVAQGNFIGIDANGVGAAGNFNEGVFLNSSDNLIGGATPGARNIISGSLNASGIAITGSGATGNLVQGNYIGTDATGESAIANNQAGILIDVGADDNSIGGALPDEGNLISGNKQSGIVLGFTSPVNGNQILGNFIGAQANGIGPLGNGQDGISLVSGSNNSIGDISGAGNVIAFNGLNGVAIASGIGNPILSNAIFTNGALGIDLGADGATPNDAGDIDAGTNDLQNSPLLTSASVSLGSTFVQGMLNSVPNTSFVLQFFSNTDCDPAGFGEGKQLIGTRTISTDPAGNASISFSFPGAFSLPITATATDPAGNTSEFSACSATAALADLVISMTSSPDSVKAGDTLTYLITVTNRSALAANNVTVSDDLPAFVTLVSCAATGNGLCLGSGNKARVTFGVIPAGAQATVRLVTTVNVLPTNAVVIINTATVSATNADSNPANNSATAIATIAGAPPLIACPADMVINAGAGQCSVIAQYLTPTITVSGLSLTVACSPPSGSAFPVGTTTVNCIARDPVAIRSACSFKISLNAPAPIKVMLEGGAAALSFGPAEAKKKNRKAPRGCDCNSAFTIENTGCAALNLTLDSILRAGNDVTSGRITNPDDSKTFFVNVANNQSETSLEVGAIVTIPAGQSRSFRVLFKPRLPAITGKRTGLEAADILPDTLMSKIIFRQNGIDPIAVNLMASIVTDVRIINPDNARGTRRARFTKSGNEFSVTFGLFDADLDANRATFEFLDSRGQVVQQAFDVDLVQPINRNNIVKGQSFIVTQSFTGAVAHPEVASVRIKVSDSRSSDSLTEPLGSSAASVAMMRSLRRAVILPGRRFN